MKETKKRCPRCKNELVIEEDKELAKTYKYACLECEENFFEFEAI